MFKNLFGTRAPAVSSGYQILSTPDLDELERRFGQVWKDKSIPRQQMEITREQISSYQNVPAMKALVETVKKVAFPKGSILEIGCSTGYHGEIFKKAGIKMSYEGCDYSPEFIRLAKFSYPNFTFKVCDATKLSYPSYAFDIVISGCCLLHIVNYKKTISEAARVSKKYVIFHRTPVIHTNKTVFTKKTGYGLEMMEILFNEEEIVSHFVANRLSIKEIAVIGSFPVPDLSEPVFVKNYLCVKSK